MTQLMSIVRTGRGPLGLVAILGLATSLQAQGPPAIQWMRGGHLHWIEQLVYSSDGTFFASSGMGDGTVKIWRASDGLLLRTLFVPRGSLVALSPDNATICGTGATAGTGPLIRCWRVADGVELWTTDVIPGTNPGDSVSKLAFSADGQRLASAVGNRLPIWNASDGAFLADFAGRPPTVRWRPEPIRPMGSSWPSTRRGTSRGSRCWTRPRLIDLGFRRVEFLVWVRHGLFTRFPARRVGQWHRSSRFWRLRSLSAAF